MQLTPEGISLEQNREQKLNHLITILRTVEDMDSFRMSVWYRKDEEAQCGFAACALGWAAGDKIFIQQGLYLHSRLWGDSDVYFDGHEGFAAAEEFFDLSENEAQFLFDEGSYYLDADSALHPVYARGAVEEIMEETGLTDDEIERKLDSLFMKGEVIEPDDVIRHIEFILEYPNRL